MVGKRIETIRLVLVPEVAPFGAEADDLVTETLLDSVEIFTEGQYHCIWPSWP